MLWAFQPDFVQANGGESALLETDPRVEDRAEAGGKRHAERRHFRVFLHENVYW